MKIEQQVGGSQATQNDYTGEARMLTVDTDNWDLRLHDGVTPGGHILVSRDNGDERWQLRSEELDGFTFAPAARGWLVRIGPGAYRLRTLQVNESNLEITNPTGYAGNPTIGLKEEIATPHHFLDDILIDGVLEVSGGVNADTSGTHTGDVVGNVTGNLTGNASGSHTGSFVGDLDVSADTLILADGQIATSKIAGLQAFAKLHGVPQGMIMLWSGAADAIPAGWALCDGTGGSPDLTDLFIVGAGGAFAVGASGGAASHTHATSLDNSAGHTHAITVAGHALAEAELPVHQHLLAKNGIAADVLAGGNAVSQETAAGGDTEYRLKGVTATPDVGLSGAVGSGSTHTHGASSASDGVHNHTVNNPGASSYPPYYALCYVMRVAD